MGGGLVLDDLVTGTVPSGGVSQPLGLFEPLYDANGILHMPHAPFISKLNNWSKPKEGHPPNNFAKQEGTSNSSQGGTRSAPHASHTLTQSPRAGKGRAHSPTASPLTDVRAPNGSPVAVEGGNLRVPATAGDVTRANKRMSAEALLEEAAAHALVPPAREESKDATQPAGTGAVPRGAPRESDASAKVQAAWRGFLVRRERPLAHLRAIARARLALEAVEARCEDGQGWADICAMPLERLRASESIMAVLLQLDTVQTSLPLVRLLRKEVVRSATWLQERIDALPPVGAAQQAPPPQDGLANNKAPPPPVAQLKGDAAVVNAMGPQAAEGSMGDQKASPGTGVANGSLEMTAEAGVMGEVEALRGSPGAELCMEDLVHPAAPQPHDGSGESCGTVGEEVIRSAAPAEGCGPSAGQSPQSCGQCKIAAGTDMQLTHEPSPPSNGGVVEMGEERAPSAGGKEGGAEQPGRGGLSSPKHALPAGTSTPIVERQRGGAAAAVQAPPLPAADAAIAGGFVSSSVADEIQELRAENARLWAALRQQEAQSLRTLEALAARVQQMEQRAARTSQHTFGGPQPAQGFPGPRWEDLLYPRDGSMWP